MQKTLNALLLFLVHSYSFILPNSLSTFKNFIQSPYMSSQEYLKNTINTENVNNFKEHYEKTLNPLRPILVQGGSLKTWSFQSPMIEQVQLTLTSEGRPIDSDIELWHGPDNTPSKMRIYTENALERPFTTVFETPRGPNTLAIKNIGQIEFPISSYVTTENIINPSSDSYSHTNIIQGGALKTYPFNHFVQSVEVYLKTDGRPLNARIELLQGPNNNKQVIELYNEDGTDRPFFCILETYGSGNVIRIINTAPMEFPMFASVLPHSISNNGSQKPFVSNNF